jgi:hypothetical protein
MFFSSLNPLLSAKQSLLIRSDFNFSKFYHAKIFAFLFSIGEKSILFSRIQTRNQCFKDSSVFASGWKKKKKDRLIELYWWVPKINFCPPLNSDCWIWVLLMRFLIRNYFLLQPLSGFLSPLCSFLCLVSSIEPCSGTQFYFFSYLVRSTLILRLLI